MKDGNYTVQSYNGKDGVLIHEDGTFEQMSKVEFPASFGGRLYVGEIILAETVQSIHPKAGTEDERESSGHANWTVQFKRMKELQTKEAERRARYGGADALRRAQ